MALPDIFSKEITNDVITRINKLTPTATPAWGKMSVSQMLAHCCVSYEYVFEDKYKKPGVLLKLVFRLLAKNAVVSEKPFPKNTQTGPDFVIKGDRDFENERNRLINFLNRTQELGARHFDGKESHNFGKLTVEEWNNMFYKHINHHLTQFGV